MRIRRRRNAAVRRWLWPILRRAVASVERLAFPGGGTTAGHWTRIVVDDAIGNAITELDPSRCSAVEISGENHRRRPWQSYDVLSYPDFDLCEPLEHERRYDVVICEQVLEHVVDPCAAVSNLRGLCAPGGHVVVATPFLIRIHELPEYAMYDYWRFTPRGLKTLLERSGLEVLTADSWGNRAGVVGNFSRWAAYRRWHPLRNEPNFPVQVWAVARNPGEAEN